MGGLPKARWLGVLSLWACSQFASADPPPATSAVATKGGKRALGLEVSTKHPAERSAPAAQHQPQAVAPAPHTPGSADLDPGNDLEIAPPAVIENCEALLEAAGVQFKTADLPVHKRKKNTFECGTPQAIRYRRGPGEIRYNSTPILSCPMALGLARFERVIQEEAERHLGSRVRRIVHVGTYSCREMARYKGWVSEHSYANALDIKEFELHNGHTLMVLRHYDSTRDAKASAFLHTVLHRAYHDNIFSVALGPPFDALHRDHFHLDQARYRVDGTAEYPP